MTQRNFSAASESAGASGMDGARAGATSALPGSGGAQSTVANDGPQIEPSAGAAGDASSAGEAGELAAGGSADDRVAEGGTSGNTPHTQSPTGGAGANSGGTVAASGSGGTATAGAGTGGMATAAGSGCTATAGAGTGGTGGAGAATVVPQSCTGLLAACGADAATNCCSAHVVSGGVFNRLNNTTIGYSATISDFILDDYEITVGRFRKFVAAYAMSGKKPPVVGSGKNPNDPSDPGWLESYSASLVGDLAAQVSCGLPYQTWTDELGANETRPINCLSWYTAQAFCIWDGGRLPTLAEWSYAAVGGAQQRYYPWSSPPNDTTIGSNDASYDCMGDGSAGCALTDLVRVGSKASGVGRYLQADLSGNVSEWVQDWYIQTPPSPCKDCANFDPGSGTGKFRNIMGGSFEKNAFNQQTSGTSSTQPVNTEYMTGARCARN